MNEIRVCENSGQPFSDEYDVSIQVMDDDDEPTIFSLCPVCRAYLFVVGRETWPRHGRMIRDEAQP